MGLKTFTLGWSRAKFLCHITTKWWRFHLQSCPQSPLYVWSASVTRTRVKLDVKVCDSRLSCASCLCASVSKNRRRLHAGCRVPDWLIVVNEHSEHAQKIGATKRISGCGDKIGSVCKISHLGQLSCNSFFNILRNLHKILALICVTLKKNL